MIAITAKVLWGIFWALMALIIMAIRAEEDSDT